MGIAETRLKGEGMIAVHNDYVLIHRGKSNDTRHGVASNPVEFRNSGPGDKYSTREEDHRYNSQTQISTVRHCPSIGTTARPNRRGARLVFENRQDMTDSTPN